MFEKLNVQNFHCDVCEYAKHHRVSFSLINKRSFIPFSLIHMDVWRPTKVHSISRVGCLFYLLMIALSLLGYIS